jgi:hypothetical protein
MGLNLAGMYKMGVMFKTLIGTVPAAPVAGTRNGSAINRRQSGAIAQGCTLFASSGAATGTPTTQTLDAKIQDSADGSTGWADYIPPDQTTVAAITQITAVNSSAEVDVNLSGAKAYIRVVETLAFTGGSTPTLGVQTAVVLVGFDRTPQ